MSMQRTTVRELMTTELITAPRTLKCDAAIELMREHDIRRLLVVGEGERLIGILTIAQAEMVMPKGSTFWSTGDEKAAVPDLREAMTDFVYTIGPEQSLGRAAQMMANHKVGALPVIEGEKLIGIITESDLFRFLAEQMPDDEGEGDATG